MSLSHALKSGIFPIEANPIDIILTAHKENLVDLLQKQIKRHHQIMRKTNNINNARELFQVKGDFSEYELINMDDMKVWSIELTNHTSDKYIVNSAISQMDSVYIDIPHNLLNSQGVSTKHSSFGILRSLRRKKIHQPINDNTVNNCYKCGIVFNMFYRRHHCRACGRIFCHNCSQWNERIPKDLISYVDTKNWIVPGQTSRVCQTCKNNIINFRRIERIVQYFEIVAYPIDLCIKASTLSRDWREAMRIYLSNIRDIQYCVPSTPLTDRDRRAILSNINYIRGHSKWMLQALKIGLAPMGHDIIVLNKNLHTISETHRYSRCVTGSSRIKKCHDMMCDRNCTEELSPFDAIIILNTPLYDTEVKLLALRILENTQFPSDLALFLPIEDLSIQDFILKQPDLFYDFFWLSRINYGLLTDVFRNKLLLENKEKASIVQESIHLISVLDENNDYNDVYKLSQKLQNLKVPFMGPFGIIDKFESDITIKNSATRPIIIKYLSNGTKRAFLYKQEDVRKDAHVVALIRLMYYLCLDIFISSKNSCFLPVTSDPIDIFPSKEIADLFTKDSPISSPHSLPISYKSSQKQNCSLNQKYTMGKQSKNISKQQIITGTPITFNSIGKIPNEIKNHSNQIIFPDVSNPIFQTNKQSIKIQNQPPCNLSIDSIRICSESSKENQNNEETGVSPEVINNVEEYKITNEVLLDQEYRTKCKPFENKILDVKNNDPTIFNGDPIDEAIMLFEPICGEYDKEQQYNNYPDTSSRIFYEKFKQNINYEQSPIKLSTKQSSESTKNTEFLATYRVIPVSKDTGFIEFVPNAATLFDILNRGTISNYLYRSNIDKKVSEVSSNYSASLAFWTVVTFLLGVGDRHLENIMIRDDGILFHIDYGFVFGADSTASFVRLDSNLIEGLGGVEMYEPFKERCCEIFCCLRRHFSLICACLLRLSSIQPPISGYNFTQKFIENFVTERFMLGQTEEEAKEAFSNIIDASRETFINKVSDVIHNTVSSLKVGWWSH